MKTNKKHYVSEETFKLQNTKTKQNYILKIETDDCPENPRNWSNVTTMICWYRNYSLGDKHNFSNPYEFMQHLYFVVMGKHWDDQYDNNDWEEIYKELNETNLVAIKLLNLYDHSGITISTSNSYPYNDMWDSSIVGFVYVTKKTAFEELVEYVLDENGERIKIEHKHPNGQSTWSYKTQELTDDTWKKRAEEVIESEVKTYDQYLTNDVFGFTLSEIIPVYGCAECEEEINVSELLTEKQLSFDGKVHYYCPHCGAEIGVEDEETLNIITLEELEEEVDNCWGFYGSCLEENGILDHFSSDLEIIE